jgi:hypothetical protein
MMKQAFPRLGRAAAALLCAAALATACDSPGKPPRPSSPRRHRGTRISRGSESVTQRQLDVSSCDWCIRS